MEKKKNEWFDWIKALLFAAVLALIVRMFFFAPIVVDGPSMLPTLENGDYMIANKLNYLIGEPNRFDIVVFHATADKDYIKRVIALEGEYVEMKGDKLYIDGKEVEEPYLNSIKSSFSSKQPYTFDFKLEDLPGGYSEIPKGYVFVLGDNRGNSTDSRMLGPIPIDQLVGVASFRYWPIDRFGIVN
ncbi:signal peptidase I [Aquibacillus salsiterrae]|uniref:Signal peptidase I n=1 Tax=Aquibacillus salsiterrae TaxID=2950439 RepID=A0A9X3WFD7_9BACI|nr:signal peptidase I [Aquibacillus salsiterrae]MDC3416414.1 signal peptidase I [Aquibacillus salsiterrae]